MDSGYSLKLLAVLFFYVSRALRLTFIAYVRIHRQTEYQK